MADKLRQLYQSKYFIYKFTYPITRLITSLSEDDVRQMKKLCVNPNLLFSLNSQKLQLLMEEHSNYSYMGIEQLLFPYLEHNNLIVGLLQNFQYTEISHFFFLNRFISQCLSRLIEFFENKEFIHKLLTYVNENSDTFVIQQVIEIFISFSFVFLLNSQYVDQIVLSCLPILVKEQLNSATFIMMVSKCLILISSVSLNINEPISRSQNSFILNLLAIIFPFNCHKNIQLIRKKITEFSPIITQLAKFLPHTDLEIDSAIVLLLAVEKYITFEYYVQLVQDELIVMDVIQIYQTKQVIRTPYSKTTKFHINHYFVKLLIHLSAFFFQCDKQIIINIKDHLEYYASGIDCYINRDLEVFVEAKDRFQEILQYQ